VNNVHIIICLVFGYSWLQLLTGRRPMSLYYPLTYNMATTIQVL